MRYLTSQGNLNADINENEERHEVQRTKAEYLVVLATAVAGWILMTGCLADFGEARCQRMNSKNTELASTSRADNVQS